VGHNHRFWHYDGLDVVVVVVVVVVEAMKHSTCDTTEHMT
jgi:hypothetical protein